MSNSSFVEILINAALNESKSIENINGQITKLQSKIKDIDVNLKVNADLKDGKIFTQINTEIEKLQKQAKELDEDLSGIGDNTKKKKPKILGGISDEVINTKRSLVDLENYLKSQGYSVKVDFSVDNKGQQKVKHVLAEIKNEMGQIETLKIKPVIDQKTGVSSFKLYGESNKDSNFKDFEKNQQKAIELLQQYSRQGKLTAKDAEDYTKRINNAGYNTNLERQVELMKQLAKVNTSDNKHHLATKNLNDNANKSIETLEKLRQKAITVGSDTKQIDSLISKMRALSTIEITNDAQIGKADKLYGRLSSRVSETKNQVDSLVTAQVKLNQILISAENKGVFNDVATLNNYRNSMELIVTSGAKLETKLERLKTLTTQLNGALGDSKHVNKMSEGANKARLEVEKLTAQLDKTINSYKRTVNLETADGIRGQLNTLSRVPNFSSESEVKKYLAELKQVEMQIKRLNAEATVGARNSMSVIESFKVAMERK